MTPICIPIFVKRNVDLEESVAEAEELLQGSPGMIELRCDSATPRQVAAAVELVHVPVIVTVRPTSEGGFSEKSDSDRLAIWEAAMEAGAQYVDVELAAWEKNRAIREVMEDVGQKHGTQIILSHHCFDRRPADLPARIKRLRAVAAASILKIAWKAHSILDAIDALRLTREVRRQDGRPLLALAMGEEGLISRLLAAKFGAPFTFASSTQGKESAPGQPNVTALRQRFRWTRQQENTPVFGVVGWPVGHSLSPHIHNAGFDALDLPGVYVPLAIQPSFEAFAATLEALRTCPGMNLRGLSVTIPHKENALRYVKEQSGQIEPLSARIGAINTIVFGEGQVPLPQKPTPPGQLPITNDQLPVVRGLNSDFPGALDALASAWNGKRESLAGKRIVLLGAGGAARAIVAGLAAHGAAITIFSLPHPQAETLAAEFNGKTSPVVAVPWEQRRDAQGDAWINTTPIGMHPNIDKSPIDFDPPWTPDTVVFDFVYNPLLTKLLKLAKKKHARIVPGTEMFIRQAAVQFEAFTHHPAPIDVFRTVLTNALQNRDEP